MATLALNPICFLFIWSSQIGIFHQNKYEKNTGQLLFVFQLSIVVKCFLQCYLFVFYFKIGKSFNMAMNMNRGKKKTNARLEFSDEEAYNEIREQVREIKSLELKQVDEEMKIMDLYNEKKQERRRRKILNKGGYKTTQERMKRNKDVPGLGEEDEEEGEINQQYSMDEEKHQNEYEGIPTIREIGDHIRPITLTRNKVCSMLKSRKFSDIVKGCFVRYLAETSGPNTNSYLLAQIVGVTESEKQYFPNKAVRTKVLLKLQQSSEVIITLTIDHLSNQHPPGVLQIQKWLQTNRNKIPKEKQLKDKKQELEDFMFGKINPEEIDRNIYEEAKKVAFSNQEIKTDLSKLIYFMKGHLHDLNVTLDQMQYSKQKEREIEEKNREREECEKIVEILGKKIAEYNETEKNKQKEQKEKSSKNKYSALFFEDRKHDKINQKHKAWMSRLLSHDGAQSVLEDLQKMHQQHDLEIDI